MDEKRDGGSFEQRLQQARSRQGMSEPDAAPEPKGNPSDGAAGTAARLGVEMASALVVGLVIGTELDRWLHTSPWFLLLFILLGMAAGVYNVWRLTVPPKPRKQAPPKGPDELA